MERYTGFYIDKPQGNNVFSYEERENKKIFVPKLIEGTLEDVNYSVEKAKKKFKKYYGKYANNKENSQAK